MKEFFVYVGEWSTNEKQIVIESIDDVDKLNDAEEGEIIVIDFGKIFDDCRKFIENANDAHRPVAPSIESELIEWIRDNCGHTGSHDDDHCLICGMCPVAKTIQSR